MSQISKFDSHILKTKLMYSERNETFFLPFLTFSKRVHARMRGYEYLIINDIKQRWNLVEHYPNR